jgi:hypothetical protein
LANPTLSKTKEEEMSTKDEKMDEGGWDEDGEATKTTTSGEEGEGDWGTDGIEFLHSLCFFFFPLSASSVRSSFCSL